MKPDTANYYLYDAECGDILRLCAESLNPAVNDMRQLHYCSRCRKDVRLTSDRSVATVRYENHGNGPRLILAPPLDCSYHLRVHYFESEITSGCRMLTPLNAGNTD